jgi:FKBP-type peptidyl-prolyl cis-trans isomerase 2
MAIKEGDFVRLNFTGKIKETDEVFDTTSEDIAEEAGILVENKVYGPIPIIVGGNHLLKAIDEVLIEDFISRIDFKIPMQEGWNFLTKKFELETVNS